MITAITLGGRLGRRMKKMRLPGWFHEALPSNAMESQDEWVRIGGWPDVAHTIFSHVAHNFALALIDTNGDGRALALDRLARGPDGAWHVIGTDLDVDPRGYEGWSPEFVFAWGTETPGETVTVGYRNAIHQIDAGSDGWWAFIFPTDPEAGDGIVPLRLA